MHADDTNYTVIKNGVVAVSGTGPAIRVDGNQLVIRDGPQNPTILRQGRALGLSLPPQARPRLPPLPRERFSRVPGMFSSLEVKVETPPLVLTRAQASRKLHNVVVCGHAGGFVTFDALRWLRDTGVAFSQLDWDGSIIFASGPRGPNRPALRRAQALVCSGVISKATVAITREILRVKLNGQAEVARLMRSADVSAEIGRLSARLARETDGSKVLAVEAHAASIYWKLWKDVPVRFARRSPQRLGPDGRWRPGRTDLWLTFGPRASQLTGKPHRATTPGNALLNYLYALLASEMTVAMLAAGLDPGIGMFHADFDGRSSPALDAIEAARPHVDYWLLGYLEASTFANRDFTELSDGEVRLTHPLNSHLAYTTVLWRKACQPIADWLAQSFFRAAGLRAVAKVEDGMIQAPHMVPPKPLEQGRKLDPLTPPLRAFIGPGCGYRQMRREGGFRDDPVPLMCWECGKALAGRQRRFCSQECATAFSLAIHQTIDAGRPEGSKLPTRIDAKGARHSSGGQGTRQSGVI